MTMIIRRPLNELKSEDAWNEYSKQTQIKTFEPRGTCIPCRDFPKLSEYNGKTLTKENVWDFSLWTRVEPDDILPDGRIFIFGHTPTESYQDKVPLSIYHGKGKIGIDCGSGNPHEACRLACLRLEDMKEYYSDYS